MHCKKLQKKTTSIFCVLQDVIFTDESRIEVQDTARKSFRKIGHPAPARKKAKHPFSFLVWGGISRRGATSLLLFNGIMNSIWYQDNILTKAFMPFVNIVFPQSHRLYQDNDPKHVSKSTQKFMKDNNINWWYSPAESPDINPIENLWHEMKVFCIKKRCKNKAQLESAIHEFWRTVNHAKCNKYINHIFKVMPAVVAANGDVSGY